MKIYILSTVLSLPILAFAGSGTPIQHVHGERSHTHSLPNLGLNHSHGVKKKIVKSAKKHSRSGRSYSYILPSTGVNHQHKKTIAGKDKYQLMGKRLATSTTDYSFRGCIKSQSVKAVSNRAYGTVKFEEDGKYSMFRIASVSVIERPRVITLKHFGIFVDMFSHVKISMKILIKNSNKFCEYHC